MSTKSDHSEKLSFPKDFLWGASTSSHQVEGNTTNQWSEWEKDNASRLAGNAQKHTARMRNFGWCMDWEKIASQALRPDNYISGSGIDHYTSYAEDFSLLRSLNMNAFRFSIEWSRIEPSEGDWNEHEIAHYHAYIAEMKAQGIEPVLTLWHWTLPVWFARKGGFTKRSNLSYFDAYVAKIATEFGRDVRYVLTLNEPNVYALASYIAGEWPPNDKSLVVGMRVYRNLMSAHKQSYTILKATNPNLEVGIAMALARTYVYNPRNPMNHLAVRAKDYVWNWWFLNRTRHHLDCVGVNFYAAEYMNWRLQLKNPDGPYNDLGWYMEPSALKDVLISVSQRYHLPVMVTENGLADSTDMHREWWIGESISAMRQAIAQGVNLRGYLHWSLLDNFEWAFGWWPKFGLIEVDMTTRKRVVRKSAKWFAKQIGNIRRQA